MRVTGLAVVLAISLAIAPLTAESQQAAKVWRIGILSSIYATSDMVGPQPSSPGVNAFLRGLRELGYVYGEHFVTEPRGGEGRPERFPKLAAELVKLQVDVIVASGPTLHALKQVTSTIPVVTTGAGDPVGQGFVQSLARPVGNVTGLSIQFTETTGKRLELLKELVQGAAPVAILKDPRSGGTSWQEAESAARKRGWKLVPLDVRDAAEIEQPSRRRSMRARALSSCSREVFSTLMPGESPRWRRKTDSPPCTHSASMSKLAA